MSNYRTTAVLASSGSDNASLLHFVSLRRWLLIPQAAQQTEVYWMALARDIPFSEYATNDIIRLAAGISRHSSVIRLAPHMFHITTNVSRQKHGTIKVAKFHITEP